MPAAALHHAGIHSRQLEEQEQLLKDDVVADAARWGGKILLHRELPPELALKAATSRRSITLGASPQIDDVTALADINPLAAVVPFWEPVADCSAYPSSSTPPPMDPRASRQLSQAYSYGSFGSFNSPSLQQLQQCGPPSSTGVAADTLNNAAAAAPQPTGAPVPSPFATASSAIDIAAANGADGSARSTSSSLVSADAAATSARQQQLDGSVSPMPMDLDRRRSSTNGLDSPAPGRSLATAREMYHQLRQAGMHITYRRIPLSRERTPEAGDCQDLYRQMIVTATDPNRCGALSSSSSSSSGCFSCM
jgi:hypothetical protein